MKQLALRSFEQSASHHKYKLSLGLCCTSFGPPSSPLKKLPLPLLNSCFAEGGETRKAIFLVVMDHIFRDLFNGRKCSWGKQEEKVSRNWLSVVFRGACPCHFRPHSLPSTHGKPPPPSVHVCTFGFQLFLLGGLTERKTAFFFLLNPSANWKKDMWGMGKETGRMLTAHSPATVPRG